MNCLQSLPYLQIFEYLDWKSRFQIFVLSSTFIKLLRGKKDKLWWMWCCRRISEESRLYIPALSWKNERMSAEIWQNIFHDLWTRRDLWELSNKNKLFNNGDERVEYSITVCARVKPINKNSFDFVEKVSAKSKSVQLPLHQLIQMVKCNGNGNNISTDDAMNQLLSRSNIPNPAKFAFCPEEATDIDSVTSPNLTTECNPGTFPINSDQNPAMPIQNNSLIFESSYDSAILAVDMTDNSILTVSPGIGLRKFYFDHCFDESMEQSKIFLEVGVPKVMDVLNGHNGSIIVYGQTGSGKTYTMFGDSIYKDNKDYHHHHHHIPKICLEGDASGLIPRCCELLLSAAVSRRNDCEIEAELRMSYVELYGNDITDLLKDGVRVGQNRVAADRYVLDGGTEVVIPSAIREGSLKLNELFLIGESMKRKASTDMNDRSTRAHTVVILTLQQTDLKTGKSITSRLFFADLGGSEQVTKSGADNNTLMAGTVSWEEYYASRRRLREATLINRGLLALKNVIRSLNENKKALLEKDKDCPRKIHIPYQDSKLTMLLASALGGDAKSVVVVTVSKDIIHSAETLQTLRFGEQCANVENAGKRFVAASLAGLVREIDDKIKEIESNIKLQERWITVSSKREDFDYEKNISIEEVVIKTEIVGAEELRGQLEILQKKKLELLGRKSF